MNPPTASVGLQSVVCLGPTLAGKGIRLLRDQLQRTIVALIWAAAVTFAPIRAGAQQALGPQEVVRGFYSWYLHQLSLQHGEPLKQKSTALKYLTPQLYANEPRLVRRMGADIFICAQDWDEGWEKNFSVSTPQIKSGAANATVVLPSGETDKIKINVRLIKTAAGWRINKVACAE